MRGKKPHASKQKALKFTQISDQEYKDTGASGNVSHDGMLKAYFSGVNKSQLLELLEMGYDFNMGASPNDLSMRISICKGNVGMALLSKQAELSIQELKNLVSDGMSYDEMKVMYELS